MTSVIITTLVAFGLVSSVEDSITLLLMFMMLVVWSGSIVCVADTVDIVADTVDTVGGGSIVAVVAVGGGSIGGGGAYCSTSSGVN